MKKLSHFKLLLTLLAATLFSFSCENITPDPIAPDTIEEPFVIQISGTDVSNVKAAINFDSSINSYPYYVGMIEKATYDNMYAANPESLLDYVRSSNPAINLSALTVDNMYVYSGSANVDLTAIWKPQADMEYYLFAFATQAGTGELMTNIEMKQFSVSSVPAEQLVSITASEVTTRNFKVTVDVGNYTGTYTVYLVVQSEYDAAGGDVNALASNLVAGDIALYGEGVFSMVDGVYFFEGDSEFMISDGWGALNANTDYYALAVGYLYDSESEDSKFSITTPALLTDKITTPALPEPTISISSVVATTSEFQVNVMANGSTDRYGVFAVETSSFNAPVSENGLNGDLAYAADYIVGLYAYNDVKLPLQTGDQTVAITKDWVLANLKPDTEYTLLAFSVSAADVASSVATSSTSTLQEIVFDASLSSVTISNVGYQTADATVDAGQYSGNYHVIPVEKSTYDGLLGVTTEELFNQSLLELVEEGTSFESINETTSSYLFTGSQVVPINGIWPVTPETEYYLLVGGVNSSGQLITDVIVSEAFTTEVAPPFELDIKVENIADEYADITVTPNVLSDTYYINIVDKVDYDGVTIESIVDELGWLITFHLTSGKLVYDATLLGLNPGSEYVVYGFGYNDNESVVTSEMFVAEFTTTGTYVPEPEVPTSVTIPVGVDFGEVTAYDITSTSAVVAATPIDKEMDYIFFASSATYFDQFATMEDLILDDLSYFAGDAAGTNSFWDILARHADPGNISFDIDISPDTEYVTYVYGIDVRTAEILTEVKYHRFKTLSPAGAPSVDAMNVVRASAVPRHLLEEQSTEEIPAPLVSAINRPSINEIVNTIMSQRAAAQPQSTTTTLELPKKLSNQPHKRL